MGRAGLVVGTPGEGVTDLVRVRVDPGRVSGWHLRLNSGHRPVRHQDELRGKRYIAAQGPVHLQQVPQLRLLGGGSGGAEAGRVEGERGEGGGGGEKANHKQNRL